MPQDDTTDLDPSEPGCPHDAGPHVLHSLNHPKTMHKQHSVCKIAFVYWVQDSTGLGACAIRDNLFFSLTQLGTRPRPHANPGAAASTNL